MIDVSEGTFTKFNDSPMSIMGIAIKSRNERKYHDKYIYHMKIELTCSGCGRLFNRYISCINNHKNKRYYHSRECYRKFSFGSNNPNFGNTMPSKTRKRISEKISESMTSNRRKQIGDQHRGKIVSDETKNKMSKSHQGTTYVMSSQAKINIGIASAARYTPEYKKQLRLRLERNGTIIPISQKDDFEFYKILANWPERMFDHITDQQQLLRLKELGIWHCKINKKGLVRDHIYSRRSGFRNLIHPEILRHPSNLQLLTSSENIGKKIHRYIDRDDQTLDELFKKIRNFRGTWFEQITCLNRVIEYEQGLRYDKFAYMTLYY